MEPEIIKPGDESGNRMVVKYTSPDGLIVYAVGVPQMWESRLGPTWSYVVEGDKLTLVDTGCNGSDHLLEEGLSYIGYPLKDVGRVIITHGHMDHDGSCFHVVEKSGAELWAHEVYSKLVGVNRWEVEREFAQLFKVGPRADDEPFSRTVKAHEELGRELKVTNVVTDGLASDGFTFFYTPGHSPDELCILFHGLLFSGDHILPQITPHPSISLSYGQYRRFLPEGYRKDNRFYGLKVYLRSLKKVSDLGEGIRVMPAHRAYYAGKFNPIGLERAGQIIEHHRERCQDLIDQVRPGPLDLETLTRRHFAHQQLDGRMFYAALTEVISHIELLEEAGDLSTVSAEEGTLVRWNGTENFPRFIDGL